MLQILCVATDQKGNKYCNNSSQLPHKNMLFFVLFFFFRCSYIYKGVWSRLQDWLKKTELRIAFFHQLHHISKTSYLAWPLRVSIIFILNSIIMEKASLSICFILSVAEMLGKWTCDCGFHFYFKVIQFMYVFCFIFLFFSHIAQDSCCCILCKSFNQCLSFHTFVLSLT